MTMTKTLALAGLLLAAAAGTALSASSSPDVLELVRASVRQQAEAKFGQGCGEVVLPDRSFVPVDVTGDGRSEYAVLFALAQCGGALTYWSGTGGGVIEFWMVEDGRPRLVLTEQMHGFTPTATGFVAYEHGSFCPDGYGPQLCVMTYRWDSGSGRFDVVRRELWAGPNPPEMAIRAE